MFKTVQCNTFWFKQIPILLLLLIKYKKGTINTQKGTKYILPENGISQSSIFPLILIHGHNFGERFIQADIWRRQFDGITWQNERLVVIDVNDTDNNSDKSAQLGPWKKEKKYTKVNK